VHAPGWPAVSSTQAAALADDWRVFTYAALAVAGLVWALILFAAVRFRRTRDNPEPRSQKDQNPALEIAWTVAPLIVVILLFVVTLHIETEVEARAPAPAAQIAVNAYRWGWTFSYRNGPTIDGTSNDPPEMVLPAGETTAIRVTSSDVVHAFWIPDMLFKRDAVPGRASTFDLTPTAEGTFLGRCGEFCGLNHALMTFRVRVVSPAGYRRWLKYEAAR
jgi:cytochrome c oxidase subunit II